MKYNVHTKGHSELAILMLLTFLAILVVVFDFFHLFCGTSYDVHTKGYNGSAIPVFLTFLALLVIGF